MKEDFDKYRDELMNLAFVRRDFPPKCSLTKCEILTWNQRVFYNEFDFFDPNNETFKITHPSKLRMFSFDDEVINDIIKGKINQIFFSGPGYPRI